MPSLTLTRWNGWRRWSAPTLSRCVLLSLLLLSAGIRPAAAQTPCTGSTGACPVDTGKPFTALVDPPSGPESVTGYRFYLDGMRYGADVPTGPTIAMTVVIQIPGLHELQASAFNAEGEGPKTAPLAILARAPDPPASCLSNGKPYSITIAVQSYSKQLAIGQRGVVSLTLSNSFPVTKMQVKLGAQVVGEITGQELRDITGIGFSVPRTAGTYSLFVSATDALGCVTSTTLARPLVVQ